VLELVVDVFAKELKATGVIHIGGPSQAHTLFTRVLHLVKDVRVDAPTMDAATDGPKVDPDARDPAKRGARP